MALLLDVQDLVKGQQFSDAKPWSFSSSLFISNCSANLGFSRCLSICLSLYHFLSLTFFHPSLFLCLSVCLSHYIIFCLWLSSTPLSFSVCLSLYHFLSLTFFLPSLFLCLSVCLSYYIIFCLYLYLPPSLFLYVPHVAIFSSFLHTFILFLLFFLTFSIFFLFLFLSFAFRHTFTSFHAMWLILSTIIGLSSSPLLLYTQRFGRYILRRSWRYFSSNSGVFTELRTEPFM